MQDKRHLIGVMTLKVVDVFFASADYADKPQKIARYAKWAIKKNGPAWYEVPTPRGLILGDAGYAVRYSIGISTLFATDYTLRSPRGCFAANSAWSR